jgi:hypothetical protein
MTMYIFFPLEESGGSLWPVVFDQTVLGLIISQVGGA